MSLIVSFDPDDYTDEQVLKGLSAMAKSAIRAHASTLNTYTFGCEPLGDMAQAAIDQEFDELLESSWYDFLHDKRRFNHYLAVAEARGLKFDLERVTQMDLNAEMDAFIDSTDHTRMASLAGLQEVV